MISLADFQPPKTNLISSTTGVLRKDVHAILIEEVPVQTTLRDSASFRRLTSLHVIGLTYGLLACSHVRQMLSHVSVTVPVN